MNPQQGHHGAGAVGADGKKIGGRFQTVSHAASDDIFFGERDTLVLPRRQPVQSAPAQKPAARPVRTLNVESMTRGARLAGAGVMAAGGFVATTAGTAMAATAYTASTGLTSGAAFLVVGIVAVAASVKTADAAL